MSDDIYNQFRDRIMSEFRSEMENFAYSKGDMFLILDRFQKQMRDKLYKLLQDHHIDIDEEDFYEALK